MLDTDKQPKKSAAIDQLATEIGKRIAEARNGLGWSQQILHNRTKIADLEGAGVSRAVLSLYETGASKPGAREMLILCEALRVTPNWLLYGTDSPAKAIQPSMIFLKGDDLNISARLAYALLALDPVERDAFSSLIFSMLTKKLSDVGLSSLMLTANFLAQSIEKEIKTTLGEEFNNLSFHDAVEKFTRLQSEAVYTNYGNSRPVIQDDEIDNFDPDIPPPPRKL